MLLHMVTAARRIDEAANTAALLRRSFSLEIVHDTTVFPFDGLRNA